jgi:alginate O-acetyltransferase complex protein AlgJ
MLKNLPTPDAAAPPAKEASAPMPRPTRLIPGAFLVLFLVAGAALTLLNPATFRSPGPEPLLTGEWTAGYSAAYDAALPIRQFGVDAWGVLGYALFAEGRRGVLIGEDGWLYTTEEFTHYPDEAARIQEKLEFVAEVKGLVEAQGARLVIALVPDKARVYPEHLGRYALPSYTAARYDAFREGAEALGVPVPDLRAALAEAKAEEAVFLRTDTHWTPFGAGVAAQAVAAAAHEAYDLNLPETLFETRLSATEAIRGDLLGFVPLGPLQHLGPAPDRVQLLETVQLTGKDVGLFDTVEIPVTLVGTSFSADGRWHFEGALKDAFQADLLNLAEEGRGPFVPMRAYLESERFASDPPRLVIWELPERYLGADDGLDAPLDGKPVLFGAR